MKAQEQHHDLALMLLVGRSLPNGLPWPPEQDQTLIAQERLLWLQLTDEEREQEQRSLAELWRHKGARRTVLVNRLWGAWAENLTEVPIPDSAFGISETDLRPPVRGIQILSQEHPAFHPLLVWLWDRGFHPVALSDGVITLVIPPHRIVQESERLVGVLLRDWPSVPVRTPASGASLTVKGAYDPVTGRATISLAGLLPGSFQARSEGTDR